MSSISIPLPDFSFTDIAESKAKRLTQYKLHIGAISQYMQGHKVYEFESNIRTEFDSLISVSDRLVFAGVLLNHLSEIITTQVSQYNTVEAIHDYTNGVNRVRYFIYSLLSNIGYNLGTDTFNEDEAAKINFDVDSIIDSLSKIEMGQEIIFEEIANLRSDIESLKADLVLGKRRWYQRATGIIVSYAGEKGVDAVYDRLKPLLKSLIKQSPEIIEKLLS